MHVLVQTIQTHLTVDQICSATRVQNLHTMLRVISVLPEFKKREKGEKQAYFNDLLCTAPL